MPSGTPDSRAEALLYLAWARGACGRFVPGGEDAPSRPATATPVPAPPATEGTSPPDPSGGPPPQARPASAEADEAWERLRAEALACRRCALCETRSTVVFGEGSRRPRLLVVGEAPGADEDATGRPFVGKAGQLLTRMLAAIGLAREDVYIANVLKCRPPGNRPPAPEEVAACRPFLTEQMRQLEPELLLLLGNHATRALLGTDRGISTLRGEIHRTLDGRPALPTFHPAYLLRNPDAKREAWLDLQRVARTLGLRLPGRAPSDSGSDPGP